MTELMETLIEGGRKGGKKRAENLTAKQLSEIGKKGAAARWGKKKKAASAKAKASAKGAK